MKPILCLIGLHKWPRSWRSKPLFLDGTGPRLYVRICKRKGCRKRQERASQNVKVSFTES